MESKVKEIFPAPSGFTVEDGFKFVTATHVPAFARVAVQAEDIIPPLVPEQYQVVLEPAAGKLGEIGVLPELTVEPALHKAPEKAVAVET